MPEPTNPQPSRDKPDPATELADNQLEKASGGMNKSELVQSLADSGIRQPK